MKKLMIALAVAAVAVASQAATIKWSTGVVKTPVDGGAQQGSTMSASNVAGMYLWSLTAPIDGDIFANYATWDTATKTYSFDTTGAVTPSVSKGNATFTGTINQYNKDETAYAAAILWYDTDKNGKVNAGDYYIATQQSYTLDADVTKTVGLGMNNATWTEVQNVPEPTSGLMLLLGVAGLALRRRRV